MELEQLIRLAFDEDIPDGDVTTDPLENSHTLVSARLIAKEDLILSGQNVFETCFKVRNSDFQIKWFFDDGQAVARGQTLCTVKGSYSDLLQAERVAINFLAHLSGVATLTRCFVNQIKNSKTHILDTRKTTPLLRALEKQAVVHGGGRNHRMSLSDAVMIKDNHIEIAGGIQQAVSAIRKDQPEVWIEVECDTLEKVKEAVGLGVQRIMLDNMSNDLMAESLTLIPASIETEASGNMSIDRVQEVANLGVNFISVGAITHSAPVADLSLIVESSKVSQKR